MWRGIVRYRWHILLGVALVTQACVAVVVLGLNLDLKWWSTTLQFGGALLASVGLLWSYLRATRFRELEWPKIRAKINRILWGVPRPQNIIVGAIGAALQTIGMHGVGTVTLHLDRAQSIEDQISQLEHMIDRLQKVDLPRIDREIVKLKDGINEAKALAESKADEVRNLMRAEMLRLSMQLDRSQAFDIRWAIAGLFISAIGTFLQYWT